MFGKLFKRLFGKTTVDVDHSSNGGGDVTEVSGREVGLKEGKDSTEETAEQWFHKFRGQLAGPISAEELAKKFESEELPLHALVKRTDEGEFSFASSRIEELSIQLNCRILDQISGMQFVGTGLFPAVDDAVLQRLSGQSEDLNLFGLKILSDGQAEILSKHQGKLVLDGLTSLSDAQAENLSKHKGTIRLFGLTSLSDTPGHLLLAEQLAKYEGGIFLCGLKSLSDAAAQIFARHDGSLCLDGLLSLSDGLAEILSHIKGELSLDGLVSLSDNAAASLANFRGTYLILDGLASLSDLAAESFSLHRGNLSLEGLTELSDAAAENLATHQGVLDLNYDKLPPSAAKIIRGSRAEDGFRSQQ